jgi:EmrB/QacA subfamily drug resistance transporter
MADLPTRDRGRPAGVAVLLVTCLSTLVVNANTSAVSILLPSISDDTGTSLTTLQWAVTGYSLVGAAVIVTSGALGDVFGRRKLFLLGIALFVASCVLIALSTSGAGVIIGRAIQGASGATILASGLSLLSVASSGQEQMRAVAIWGAASAVGAAAGPLVGGLLVDGAGWQGLFWLDAGIALVCVPLTLRGVEESNDPARSHSIDYAGTALIGATLAALILGMTKGTDWGWISPATLATFATSGVALAAFLFVERRVRAPLVDLSLLRNSVLVGATVAILIGAGTINAMGYLVSIYFQDPDTLDMTALEAGLATLPATVGLVAVTPLVPTLATKLGTRQTISLGFLLSAAGFLVLAFVQDSWAYGAFVLPMLTAAVGMGLSNGPASSASTACVETDQVGAASGISNMARYVGAAVGVAAVAAIYTGVGDRRLAEGDPTGEALAAGLGWSFVLLAAVSAAGILMGLAARHRALARPIDAAAATAAHAHTIAPPRADISASGEEGVRDRSHPGGESPEKIAQTRP